MKCHGSVWASVGLSFVVGLLACSQSPSDGVVAVDAGADGVTPSLPALGLNDVSVLLPLPTGSGRGYLTPTSAGERGPLLPRDVYDAIPKFGVQPAQGLDFDLMRTLAIRFDGCFPSRCEPQIRLVMQPVEGGGALDSALHLFYRLSDAELAELVKELRRLRTLAPEVADAPLTIHAALVAQGVEGEYGAALRELVLRYAGESNLVRMTFFLRAPPRQEEWFFGGFDRVGGKLEQLDIKGVGKANQRVDRPITTADGFTYVFTPSPTKPEDISALLSTEAMNTSDEAALKAAIRGFARIDNPTVYGPDDLSCAGCHVSTFVTEVARAKKGLDVTAEADAYKSSRDLSLTTEASSTPSSLRAFGWFDKKPMIGKRVVNESAHVADDLEKRFPR